MSGFDFSGEGGAFRNISRCDSAPQARLSESRKFSSNSVLSAYSRGRRETFSDADGVRVNLVIGDN